MTITAPYRAARPAPESCLAQGHTHSPGPSVLIEAGERAEAACTDCGTLLVQVYEHTSDEDRLPGWGRWRVARTR